LVDRNVLLKTGITFTIAIGSGANGANIAPGVNIWQYGLREAFNAFPINALFTTVTLSVNNTSVSINLQDVLPQLLHLMDEEEIQKYKGFTPTMIDKYKYYSDAIGSNNNPLAGYETAGYNRYCKPRGAHPLKSVAIQRFAVGVFADTNPVSQALTDSWVITVSSDFVEPLFISPLLVHSKYNQAAILGVNNLNLVF
jgi:hypothetical protein